VVVGSGGLLNASGTTFTASTTNNSGLITVNSGGHLQANASTFALSSLTLNSGSTDTIQLDTFSGPLTIDSGATYTINANDLTNVPGNNGGIIATGSATATIDLTNNFWGTGATAAQIAAKIKDHTTDPTRPTVLYQPYLSAEPTQTIAAPASATFNTAAQNVTLSATVNTTSGTVGQGTVTFTVLNGSTPVGNATSGNVSGGTATATYTLPAATSGGTYTIQAVYGGTASLSSSSDSTHTLTVNAASTTTAAANASATYSAGNQSVHLSATVTSSAGTVSEGSVTFTLLNGSTPVGSPVSGNVTAGSASANYTLPAGTAGGTYTIQATYNGTAEYATSSDTSHTLTVNAAVTTTAAVTTAAVFSAASQAVSLSATVTSPAGTVNGGSVTFTILNGGTTVGNPTSGNVTNGSASVSYTLPAGLADGSYSIQAAYNGTADFVASTDSSQSLYVGTIIWVAAGGGSWDTPSNWSPQRVPTSTDDVVIVKPGVTVTKSGGSINVQSVISTAALSFSSTSMTITAGPSQFQAGLTLTSSSFNFNGGSIGGTVTLNNSALVIGSGSTGAANFVMEGSDTLTGNVAAGQSLWVQGNGTTNSGATLTVAGNVTNHGTILLESVYSNYFDTLATGSNTFTNAADGTIQATANSGGSRTISGTLVNQGLISVDGSSYLTVQGTYYAAGGSITGPGYLYNTALYVTASPSSPTTILLEGGGDTLETNNLPNTTLWVQGNGYVNQGATLNVAAGLSNDGTILLESIYSNYFDTLATGTFTNAADGTIQVTANSGGSRTITGTLINAGTVNFDTNTTLGSSGAKGAN